MMVEIGPDLEAVIRERVDGGKYPNAEEVVQAALRLLKERDDLEELRAKVKIGLDQLDRGEGVVLTPAVYEQILENARQRYRDGAQPNPDVLP